jgi:hypothetical protein
MNPAEYAKLKDRLESFGQEAARAEGALREVKGRLKKKFGVPTLKAARRLLKRLTREERELSEQADTDLAKLKQDHPYLWEDER